MRDKHDSHVRFFQEYNIVVLQLLAGILAIRIKENKKALLSPFRKALKLENEIKEKESVILISAYLIS